MAQILQPTLLHLDRIAEQLSKGEIAAVPTETVYGLAGNALNPEAIAKIYAAKARPARNPLIVHIHNQDQLREIAVVPEAGTILAKEFWPGPLTLIFRKRPVVPDSVTAGLGTVAVRMPSHPVYRELARRCPFPLAAPSANPFGYVSPTRAEHVATQMGSTINWILDGGPCESGIESTIVSLVEPKHPLLLRKGGISVEEVERILGVPVVRQPKEAKADEDGALASPGLMKRHYSPKTPIQLFEGGRPTPAGKEAVVFLDGRDCQGPDDYGLSDSGDLKEVARNLYDRVQTLDRKNYARIHLELPENRGIGQALRDRMTRAAAK